jgi:hypothetical protein
MHLLTPKGIRQKLSLTIHFLERKQAEYEHLKLEIASLQTEIGQQQPQLGNPKGLPSAALPGKMRNPENSEGVTA